MFLKYVGALIREWVLWVFFGLDLIGLAIVYAPLIAGRTALVSIPPIVLWLLPVLGVAWAGYRVFDSQYRQSSQADLQRSRDSEAFEELKKVLPHTGSIRWLRDYDFGSSFNTNWFEDLHRFNDKSNDPNFEFIDPELEALRITLQAKCEEFIRTIGSETEHVKDTGNGGHIIRIPYEMSYKDRQRFQKIRTRFNGLADDIVKTYDDLVKRARRKTK
jgi:hypothetical protein